HGPTAPRRGGVRRPRGRARPAAAAGPRVLPQVPGPQSLRHRQPAEARDVPQPFPLAGDRRRILRLLGLSPPGPVEDLRPAAPRPGAREGLPPECRARLRRVQGPAGPGALGTGAAARARWAAKSATAVQMSAKATA